MSERIVRMHDDDDAPTVYRVDSYRFEPGDEQAVPGALATMLVERAAFEYVADSAGSDDDSDAADGDAAGDAADGEQTAVTSDDIVHTDADGDDADGDGEAAAAPTCAGNDGECSREVDDQGGYCWQHAPDEGDEA